MRRLVPPRGRPARCTTAGCQAPRLLSGWSACAARCGHRRSLPRRSQSMLHSLGSATQQAQPRRAWAWTPLRWTPLPPSLLPPPRVGAVHCLFQSPPRDAHTNPPLLPPTTPYSTTPGQHHTKHCKCLQLEPAAHLQLHDLLCSFFCWTNKPSSCTCCTSGLPSLPSSPVQASPSEHGPLLTFHPALSLAPRRPTWVPQWTPRLPLQRHRAGRRQLRRLRHSHWRRARSSSPRCTQVGISRAGALA